MRTSAIAVGLVLTAEVALAQTPPPTARQIAMDALVAEKAEAELAEQVAKAKKAAIEAKDAAAKAAIGTIPDAPEPKGSVTVKENGGRSEAMLMAARAATRAAVTIADEVRAVPVTGPVILLIGMEPPSRAAWAQFDLGARLLADQFERAAALMTATRNRFPAGAPAEIAIESLTPIGAGIEAAAKLAQFFQGEYTVQGIAIDANSTALATALAMRLRDRALIVPALYPAPTPEADAALFARLTQLADASAIARGDATEAEAQAVATAGTPAASAFTRAAAAARDVLAAYDAFMTRQAAADDKGVVLIERVRREHGVDALLARPGAVALMIEHDAALGGLYTVRNLWTIFGGPPVHVMGGAIASYLMVRAADGVVLAGGTIPIHGGYRTLSGIDRSFNPRR